jgi:hypothetical protein
MNLVEKTPHLLKGEVEFILLSSSGDIIFQKKNQIQADAQEVIAKALASQDYIKSIKVYKTAGLLASANVTYTFPTSDSVKFSALFDEASFNDTLDEARLVSNAALEFSIITALSILKSNTNRLLINWKITINDIP